MVTSTAQTIDDLSYIYQSINGGTQNTNRLARVNEAVSGATGDAGFKNGASSDTEFTFSAWGSATKDENKGISAIDYNVLGKARRVTYTSGKVVEYTYDATGTKLTMKVLQGATVESLTSYVGGFVYEGATPALSFFASPEGRVVKNGSSYEYQYSISDHQGNTRIIFSSAAPTTSTYTATFETSTQTAEQANFNNYPSGGSRNSMDLYDHTDDGSTYTYSYLLTGGYDSQVGLARSFHAYPGDSVKIEAWAKYYGSEGGTSNVAGFATALLSAFSLSAPGGGETGTPSAALNTWGGLVAGGDGGDNESHPKAFVNIIVFDKNYNLLEIAYDGINGGHQVGASPDVAHDFMKAVYAAKEECFVYVYISNENANLIDVYFDDVVMTHKRSRLIQGNEYYPFGMQTANSWTRESVTGNNYLANGGTELNATTQLYDLEFRNYDPALGRMFQVDPVAAKYASMTPYNYSFNNPIAFSDPSGADPDPDYQNPNHQYYFHNGAGAAGYPGLTYDDWVPQSTRGEYNNAYGWRTDFALGWFGGGGQSLNAGSFGYQATRHHMGQVLKGIGAALYSDHGGEVSINSGAVDFFDEKGSMVAGAIYKTQHGQMTEELAKTLATFFTPLYTGPGVDDYFEGVRVIDATIGDLKGGAAFTLPGVGIFLSKEFWGGRPQKDLNDLLKHEYGHVLQAEKWGIDFFFEFVAPLSFQSALQNDGAHKFYWTERTANYFSMQYFGSENWNYRENPIEYPSKTVPNRNFKTPPFGLPGLPVWWDKSDTQNRS